MKNTSKRALIFLIFCLFPALSFSQKTGKTYEFYHVSQRNSVSIQLLFGQVKIIGEDRQDIELITRNDTKQLLSSESNGILVSQHRYDISFDQERESEAEYVELRIPKDIMLRVHVRYNGRIEVSQMTGEVNVSSENGAITFTDLSGNILANTQNGAITLKAGRLHERSRINLASMNGNITASVPKSTKANVSLKTISGEIFTSNLVKRIREDINRWSSQIEGQLNGDNNTNSISLYTMNGDVSLKTY